MTIVTICDYSHLNKGQGPRNSEKFEAKSPSFVRHTASAASAPPCVAPAAE